MPSPLGPFLDLWKRKVGLVEPGRAARALFPAIKEYGGSERVLVALENYLKDPKINVHRLEYFVQGIAKYLPPDPAEVPPEPPLLVDRFGDLTDDGAASYYGRR